MQLHISNELDRIDSQSASLSAHKPITVPQLFIQIIPFFSYLVYILCNLFFLSQVVWMILNIFSYLTVFIKSKFVQKIFTKKFHLTLSICNTLVYNNVDLKNTQTIDEEEIIMSYTEEVYERVVAQNPNEPELDRKSVV